MREIATEAVSELPAETRRRGPGKPFAAGKVANPGGRGSRARREEAERACEAAALAADLGHPPSAAERMLIDEAAALVVRARRLRRQGEPADDVARLLTRILSKLAIKPGKPAAGSNLDRYLAEKHGKPA